MRVLLTCWAGLVHGTGQPPWQPDMRTAVCINRLLHAGCKHCTAKACDAAEADPDLAAVSQPRRRGRRPPPIGSQRGTRPRTVKSAHRHGRVVWGGTRTQVVF